MLSPSKAFLACLALATAAMAYSDSGLYAREAEYDDPIGHLYSRDLEVREAQIQDDLEAVLRVRELAQRDPETLELAKRMGIFKGALLGAGAALATKWWSNRQAKKQEAQAEAQTGAGAGPSPGAGAGAGAGAGPEPGMTRRWLEDELDLDYDY